MSTDPDEGLDELLDRAVAHVESLEDERYTSEEVVDLLVDVLEVVDEAEDLLSVVDVSRVAKVIRWENLAEAVDVDRIAEAVDARDPSLAVDLGKLIELSDLSEIWASADTREAWRQKRELSDEVEDVAEYFDDSPDSGGDGGGFVDGEDVVGDDENNGDGPLPEDDRHGPFSADPETVANRIQMEMSDSTGELRESLVETHERLREELQSARKRVDRRRDRWSGTATSRNPTAVSTLPRSHLGGGAATTGSTVPEETKYSTAPNRRRIYGRRFESERGDGDD